MLSSNGDGSSLTGITYSQLGTAAVADGGTGRTTSTTAYGLIAAGTTATGAHQTLPAGATTEILVGAGASALPKFAAYMGSDQSIATSTFTKVSFNTEFFDTNSNYDSATNYRFTPTAAGKYLVGGHVYWGNTAGAGGVSVFIRKNGSDYARLDQKTGTASISIMGGSTLVDMNGSTDYLEFFVYQDSGAALTITAASSITQFWGSILP